MSYNDSNHQKKSAFPPYVTMKQRCSSAAATSRLHQKFGIIDVLPLAPRLVIFTTSSDY